jgi:hypothetical protein
MTVGPIVTPSATKNCSVRLNVTGRKLGKWKKASSVPRAVPPPTSELRKLERKEIKALLYIDIAVVTSLDSLLKDP